LNRYPWNGVGCIDFFDDDNRLEEIITYLECSRLAFTSNGDRIKYNGEEVIEWVFSPSYGWNNMPEEVKNVITKNNLEWIFFREYIPKLYNQDGYYCYRTTFFVIFSKGKWGLTTRYKYYYEDLEVSPRYG
jgi:hypothetical protein